MASDKMPPQKRTVRRFTEVDSFSLAQQATTFKNMENACVGRVYHPFKETSCGKAWITLAEDELPTLYHNGTKEARLVCLLKKSGFILADCHCCFHHPQEAGAACEYLSSNSQMILLDTPHV